MNDASSQREPWTAGPWAWFGDKHDLYLATTHSGRRYVMGFQRMGMRGAQPVFQVAHRMVPAAQLVTFEVGDQGVRGFAEAALNSSVYRTTVSGIDAADARLIAAAPCMAEALAPFVQALLDCGDEPDDRRERKETDDLWESPVALSLTFGDLYRARVALARARGEVL